jgi:hypothetical protein
MRNATHARADQKWLHKFADLMKIAPALECRLGKLIKRLDVKQRINWPLLVGKPLDWSLLIALMLYSMYETHQQLCG